MSNANNTNTATTSFFTVDGERVEALSPECAVDIVAGNYGAIRDLSDYGSFGAVAMPLDLANGERYTCANGYGYTVKLAN